MARKMDSENISRHMAEFITAKSVNSPETPWKDIFSAALQYSRKINDSSLNADQSDAVRKRVAKARKNLSDEDQLWNLTSDHELRDRLVPVGLREIVLDVFAWHTVGGTRFTFRQVKWVTRLHQSFSYSNPDMYSWRLANFASEYANEERVAEAIGKKFESSELDWQMAMEQRSDRSKSSRTKLLTRIPKQQPSFNELLNHWDKYDHLYIYVLDDFSQDVARFLMEETLNEGTFKVDIAKELIPDRALFETAVIELRHAIADIENWPSTDAEIKEKVIRTKYEEITNREQVK
jgi:hypothetical protein